MLTDLQQGMLQISKDHLLAKKVNTTIYAAITIVAFVICTFIHKDNMEMGFLVYAFGAVAAILSLFSLDAIVIARKNLQDLEREFYQENIEV